MSPDSKPAASSTLKLLTSMKASDVCRKMSPLEYSTGSTGPKEFHCLPSVFIVVLCF